MSNHKHEYTILPSSGETGCVQCSLQVIRYRLMQLVKGTITYRDFYASITPFDYNVLLNLRKAVARKEEVWDSETVSE